MATFRGTPNYSPGRSQPVKKIVIHWIVGNLDAADATFANAANETSAHYAIENGTVHQYVREGDTAWHAMSANPYSIGIEHSAAPGRAASDATYRTSINLCADICKRYGLDPDADIVPHNRYVATQCPGNIDIPRIIRGVKNLIKGEDMVLNEREAKLLWPMTLHREASDEQGWRHWVGRPLEEWISAQFKDKSEWHSQNGLIIGLRERGIHNMTQLEPLLEQAKGTVNKQAVITYLDKNLK